VSALHQAEIAWHYTTCENFIRIVDDGFLRPTAIGIRPPELPILWFSLNQLWELTANKMLAKNGCLTPLTREETMRHGRGLARFGRASMAFVRWPAIGSLARMPRQIRRALEAQAVRQGANPADWMGGLEAITVSTMIIEILDDKLENWVRIQPRPIGSSVP
jgi:hypothetical protein